MRALLIGLMAAVCSIPVVAQAREADMMLGVDRLLYPSPVSDLLVDGSKVPLVYGTVAAFDYAMGHVFVGVEAESAHSLAHAGLTQPEAHTLATLDKSTDRFVGLRGGYAFRPGLKFYAKGGYSKAGVRAGDFNAAPTQPERREFNGLGLGVGGELASGSLRFRLEYRHSAYGAEEQDLGLYLKSRKSQVVTGLVANF